VFSDDDLILEPKFIYHHRMMHKDRLNLVVHGQIYSLPYLKFFKDPTTGELHNRGKAKKQLFSKTIRPEIVSSTQFSEYLKKNSKVSKFEKDIKLLYENTSIIDSYVRWIGVFCQQKLQQNDKKNAAPGQSKFVINRYIFYVDLIIEFSRRLLVPSKTIR